MQWLNVQTHVPLTCFLSRNMHKYDIIITNTLNAVRDGVYKNTAPHVEVRDLYSKIVNTDCHQTICYISHYQKKNN